MLLPCVALAALALGCSDEPTPAPGLWLDVFDGSTLETHTLRTSAHALSDPANIATAPVEFASYEVSLGGTTNIDLVFDKTGVTSDTTSCYLDGVYKGDTASSSYTFQAVGKGLHTLACELLNSGAIAAWARRRVKVLEPCSVASSCDDSLACSVDFCPDGRCDYDLAGGCCASRFDCAYEGGCVTLDSGGGAKVCSPCDGQQTLCQDNRACTSSSCPTPVSPAQAGTCTYTSQSCGSQRLDECQDFGSATQLADTGWSQVDLSGSSPPDWGIETSGGPASGKFAALAWDTSAPAFDTCLVSPLFASTSTSTGKVTMQFTDRYTEDPAHGASLALSVRYAPEASPIDWTAATEAASWTLDGQQPAAPRSVLLPGGSLGSDGFRVAICGAGISEGAYEIDDLCVAFGEPPVLTCPNYPIVLYVEPGAAAFDFVEASDPEPGQTLSFSLTSAPSFLQFDRKDYFGYEDRWLVSFDASAALKNDAGLHTATVQASDGLLTSRCTFQIEVIYPEGILIWAPSPVPPTHVTPIKDALLADGHDIRVIEELNAIGDLTAFDAVFAVLGIDSTKHDPTTAEENKLIAYLQQGGALAWIGGDACTDASSTMKGYLQVQVDGAGPSSGSVPGPLKGYVVHMDQSQAPAVAMDWGYDQNAAWGAGVDRISATNADDKTRSVLLNDKEQDQFWLQVANEDVYNGKTYRTLASSVPLAGITAGAYQPADHVLAVANFLLHGFPSCVVDTDCNDGSACTADTCNGWSCSYSAANCDDGNSCTSDTCSGLACSHTAVSGACDDGVACNGADSCAGGTCAAGSGNTCASDGNPCTTAACVGGCVQQANSASCDDGNPCTLSDTCASGMCGGGVQTLGSSAKAYCPSSGTVPAVPADPDANAPALTDAAATSISAAVDFLYQGGGAIQTGVAQGAIKASRLGTVRGQVFRVDGQGALVELPKVKVAALDHDDYGETYTRADGRFDLVVNGGETVALRFELPGYLPVHRHVKVPARDHAALADVVMLQPDVAVTTVTFGAGSAQQQVLGTEVSADDPQEGSRRPRLLFAAGTTATITKADDTTDTLTTGGVRITEYTEGDDGPKAMPADLPGPSRYTYCVELSIDEALSIGAKKVTFNKDVVGYVDNFLGLQVGATVPVGWYDRQGGKWVQEGNGHVIKVLAPQGGLAGIDLDGTGVTPPDLTLAELGIDNAERTKLAAIYPNGGVELWRFRVKHFTPYDLNLGGTYTASASATAAPAGLAGGAGGSPNGGSVQCGSIIGCEGQSLGERASVAGTPLGLHYHSTRMPGAAKRFTHLDVDLAPDPLPSQLVGVELEVTVAGQMATVSKTGAQAKGQSYSYDWDGKDAFGRLLQGRHKAVVRTGWVYQNNYIAVGADPNTSVAAVVAAGCDCTVLSGTVENDDVNTACIWPNNETCLLTLVVGSDGVQISTPASLFALPPAYGVPQPVNTTDFSPARSTQTIWTRQEVWLGQWRADKAFGGWRLDVHHAYDPGSRTLFRGDGTSRKLDVLALQSRSIAGGGSSSLENNPATSVDLAAVDALLRAPDGRVFFSQAAIVYEIDTQGVVHSVAGGGSCPTGGNPVSSCDGSDATAVTLYAPSALALDRNLLYIAEKMSTPTIAHRIRVVDLAPPAPATSPTIKIFANTGGGSATAESNGSYVKVGDNGTALNAKLKGPVSLVIGPDRAVYVADTGHRRVRRIDPRGWITTVAGDGSDITSNGGLIPPETTATQTSIGHPSALAFDARGDLWIGIKEGRMFRLLPTGRLQYVELQGEHATGTNHPIAALTTDPAGALYYCGGAYSSNYPKALWHRDASGATSFYVGRGAYGDDDEQQRAMNGGLPTRLFLQECRSAMYGADGGLYAGVKVKLSEGVEQERIIKVSEGSEGWSGNDIAVPSEDGRQIFHFDKDGLHNKTVDATTGVSVLIFIYDQNNYGRLLKVANAAGQEAVIDYDGGGRAKWITSPFGHKTSLRIGATNLLEKVIYADGTDLRFEYDAGGLMTRRIDQQGNATTFEWETDGRLKKDTRPLGGYKSLARPDLSETDYEVTITADWDAAKTKTDKYRVQHLSDGTLKRTRTDAVGLAVVSEDKPDGTTVVTGPDGSRMTSVMAASPRFSTQVLHPSTTDFETPRSVYSQNGGLKQTLEVKKIVSPAGKVDPADITTLTHETTINGKKWTSVWDNAADTITTTSPVGRKTEITLDVKGRPTQVRMIDSQTPPAAVGPTAQYTYDAQKHWLNAIAISDGASTRTTTLAHDTPTGWLSTITNPLSEVVGLSRDAMGRPVSISLPASNGVIELSRDASGRVKTLRAPALQASSYSPTYRFAFDADGRLASEQLPLAPLVSGATTSYGYDIDGVVNTVTLPDASVLQATRDTYGRVDSITMPDVLLGGANTVKTTLAFHGGAATAAQDASAGRAKGRLDYVEGPAPAAAQTKVKVAITWDGFLPLTETWTGADIVSGAVSTVWNANFAVATSVVDKAASPSHAGTSIAYSYDDDGLLTDAGGLSMTRSATTGQLTGTSLSAGGKSITTTWLYNGFGEPKSYEVKWDGQVYYKEEWQGAGWARDGLGRLTKRVVSGSKPAGATWLYEYDAMGRVTKATKGAVVTTWGYDGRSNRTTIDGATTAAYDDQDRLVAHGNDALTWSADGRLLSKGAWSFVYDHVGNLLWASKTGTTVEYVVDGFGRRILRKVGGQPDRGWLYQDALNPVAEIDSAGHVRSRFVYGTRGHVPDYMLRFNDDDSVSGTYRLVHDHLGSVRLVVDVSDGSVKEDYDYDAWGVVTAETIAQSWERQPFGFAGGLVDPDTGLVRFGARDYDPEVGRWTGRDPIGFAAGDTNLWAYVGSDPVNLIDPSGLQADPESCPRPADSESESGWGTYVGVGVGVAALGIGIYYALRGAGGGSARQGWSIFAGRIGAFAGRLGGASKGVGSLSRAGEFGFQPYIQLTKALKGTGLKAHHLIEQRFAGLLGGKASQGLSVAVTKAEHQAFTNAWRRAIPYGQGTRAATRESVIEAAKGIYKDHPAILQALGL